MPISREIDVYLWCHNRLVNTHWKCLKGAVPTADFQTRHGIARNRWGAESKHPDRSWYGDEEDDSSI